MCRSGEEALAVADLDDVGVADLPVWLTRHDLEEITIWANRRRRDMTQLLACHLVLMDLVVRSINLNSEIQVFTLLGLFVCHLDVPSSLNCHHDTTPPRYLTIGVACSQDGFMKPAKAMTIRLSAEQADELETVATVDNQPVSEVVRAAIAEHIEKRKRDEHFQDSLKDRISRAQQMLGKG